jgi:succinoglycan biosynthesis protein ExoM
MTVESLFGMNNNFGQRLRLVVAICTYRRNEPLKALLKGLTVCGEAIQDRAGLGVVIVDDTPEGLARPVAEAFAERFELGLMYGVSGKQNISLARNQAIEGAMHFADWIAMTDDDCEPHPHWLKEFLEVQERTGADAVTGSMRRRAPDGSPAWLTEQPFLEVGINSNDDGAPASTGSTNCSMIRAQWLREHPNVRFDPDYGVLGGEDMVFYRGARTEGLKIHYSSNGFVYENQPASRLTYRYQLARFLWEGNSSYVTCVQDGVPPWRMLVHGGANIVRGGIRPLARIAKGRRPQWRYGVAAMAQGLGAVCGFMGVRIKHH